MKPECIIFDEPTAMLDPKGRSEVMNIIRKLHSEGITIILITHFMEEAALADRLIIMHEGQISLEGPPRNVLTRIDELKKLSLEAPEAARMAYLLNKEGIALNGRVLNVKELADEIWPLK